MSRLPGLIALAALALPLSGQAFVPQADLRLEASLAGRISAGDWLSGWVILRNHGPDMAENVVVTTAAGRFEGQSCGTARCTIAAIPPGGEHRMILRIDGESLSGRVVQAVEVTSTTPDPNPRNNRVTAEIELTQAARLRFSMYGGIADPGGTVEYETYIINESSIAATNVSFTLPLPEGWSFERSLSNDLRCSGERNVTCTVAHIGPRATVRHRFALRAPLRVEGAPYTSVPVTLTTEHGILNEESYLTGYLTTSIYRHLTVTSTADAGEGSLRDAITAAHELCTNYPAAPCKVVFDIAGEGTHRTIRPATPLPPIAVDLRIEGGTQAARHGDTNPHGPEIEIDGSLLTAGDGFTVAGEASFRLADVAVNGFPGNGVSIRTSGWGRSIERCYIGTDVTGRVAVPNGGRGVAIEIPSAFTRADVFLRDNVISGNARSGVFAPSGFEITLTGNRIGASAGELPAPLGNGASGIYLGPGTSAVVVQKNVIAFNREAGIAAAGIGFFAFHANSIHSNGGLGIDYGLDSVTPNPPPDQFGAYPPFPVLTSARYDPATGITRIEGTMELRFPPSLAEIELFANTSPGLEGHGEGELFLGRASVRDSKFSFDFRGDLRGRFITATYTRPNQYYPEAPYLRTSEFSAAVKVDGEAAGPLDPAATVPRGADVWLRLYESGTTIAGMSQQLSVAVGNFGPAAPGPVVIDIETGGGRVTTDDGRCTTNRAETALRCALPEPQAVYFHLHAPIDGGTVSVRARVTATAPDPDPANNEVGLTLPVQTQPGLDVDIDPPGPIDPGGTGTYVVHVAHRTAIAARDVEIRVRLPHGWSMVPSTSNGWSCTSEASDVVCRTPRIEGRSFQSFAYTVRAPALDSGGREGPIGARVSVAGGLLFPTMGAVSYQIFRVFRVTTTADDGAGSLRDAITRANAECQPGRMECKVMFAIDAAQARNGVFTIQPTRPLPAIETAELTIDGRTQTAHGGDTNPLGPEVELNGARAGAGHGLEILTGGTCVIRGLAINGFPDNGILVRKQSHGGFNPARQRIIVENYIGTDATGRIAVPNGGRGITVEKWADLPSDLDIVSNVIGGNARAGIFVGTGDRIRIANNRIGLAAGDAATPLPNGASGIYLGRADTVLVEGNGIAFNAHAGIAVDRHANWTGLRGNAIWSNGGLAVDHGLDMVTFNDDAARRAELPRFPVILSATWDAGAKVTRIEGRAEGSRFGGVVELFANAEADPSGYGEAQRPLGAIELPPSSHEQPFAFTIAEDLRGTAVTATLTRRSDYAQNWTSEVSPAVPVP